MSHDIKENADGTSAAVFTASTWHGMETVQSMVTARDIIDAGEKCLAYPTEVCLEAMRTSAGLPVPGKAVVATYLDGARVALAAMGARYTPLAPKEWRATIEAAVKAGARPSGAFALNGGVKILATFEVHKANGIVSYLNLVDSLDGSTAFVAGGTSVRTVCANTLAVSMREDGKGYAKIRHTGSINERAEMMRLAIDSHIKRGESVASMYAASVRATLTRTEAQSAFDALWPAPSEGDSKRLASRKANRRLAATQAMSRAENADGPTLATLWNAATWLVDRDEDGNARPGRGGACRIDSMLFGSRGRRVAEVQNIVQVILANGEVGEMTAPEAASAGINHAQIGGAMRDAMLA